MLWIQKGENGLTPKKRKSKRIACLEEPDVTVLFGRRKLDLELENPIWRSKMVYSAIFSIKIITVVDDY
jgi:hypothetical protein